MFSYCSTFLWLVMITLCTSKPYDNFMPDMRLLDEDRFDIFNKTLASKSTSTMRNYGGAARTPRTPPTAAVPYTSQYTPSTTSPIIGDRDIPSHAPHSRNSFTPPLPVEYLNLNPFADKPTLRGSNSDNTISNRRPIPHPPVKSPAEKERIPIRPPDLVIADTKKKSINTPSVQKLPDVLNYSEPSSSPTSTTHKINDTYDIVIPMVHNISFPSILRILDNGKKHDFIGSNKPRLDPELKPSKTFPDEVAKSSNPTTSKSTMPPIANAPEEENPKDSSPFIFPQNNVVDVSVNQDNQDMKEQQITADTKSESQPAVKSAQGVSENVTLPAHVERRVRLGYAWDMQVYLMATMFAVLASVSAFSLLRIRAYKWLLPCSYFLTIHGLLMIIGIVRSLYLFYNPYNITKSFSEPVSNLLLNIVYPCLITIFTLMFTFIVKMVDVKIGFYYVQKTCVLLTFIGVYITFSVCIDLYANITPFPSILSLISQCVFILLCVILCVTYIYLYKFMSHASLRKHNSVYGTTFADPVRSSLSDAIRLMLATSLLGLLMAAVQSISMSLNLEPFQRAQQHPWIWWALQFSFRVIEVSMCFLIFWAAVKPLRSEDEKETQSHNSASGFALFSWGVATPRGSENGNADDIYPTICSTNQAIHNYSLRTGKQVYEDIFPLNNIHSSGPVPSHLLSHTTERRSIKRHPPDGDITRCGGTLVPYPERRPQPSSSMLVDEKGIVRFRSFVDPDPHLVHSSEEYSS